MTALFVYIASDNKIITYCTFFALLAPEEAFSVALLFFGAGRLRGVSFSLFSPVFGCRLASSDVVAWLLFRGTSAWLTTNTADGSLFLGLGRSSRTSLNHSYFMRRLLTYICRESQNCLETRMELKIWIHAPSSIIEKYLSF